mgnify:CR=1 FL=1|tara:strand:+ start:330 stop:830 length:501 start_codon:yes stop_codon:yes gene_type:complete
MKITKQRLKEIIKEELDAMRGSVRLGADIDELPEPEEEEDLSREGGTSLERLLNKLLIRVEVDRFESAEEAAEWLGVDETDEELMGYLRKVMDDSFLAPMEEGWGQGDRAYQQATQLLGKHAQMHGLRNAVATALRQKRISPQQVQRAAQGAVSSYQVAQRLGLGE